MPVGANSDDRGSRGFLLCLPSPLLRVTTPLVHCVSAAKDLQRCRSAGLADFPAALLARGIRPPTICLSGKPGAVLLS